jgi:hypothetical protein
VESQARISEAVKPFLQVGLAMSDSILNIIINTVKRGGGDKEAINNLVKMKTQFKEITGINLSSLTAYAAVGAAVGKIIDLTKKSIELHVQYAGAVDNLNNITGDTAENTSRLVQVAKLYGLTVEDLAKSQKKLAESSETLNKETIIELAQKYQTINNAADRQLFLTDKLGKAGQKWAEILTQDTAALEKQFQTVNKGLILTEEQIKQAEEYEVSQIQMKNNWEAVGNAIGRWFIPVSTTASRLMAVEMAAARIAAEQHLNLYTQHKKIYDLAYAEVAAQERTAVAIAETGESAEEAARKLEEYYQANKTMLSLVESFSKSGQDYQKNLEEINQDLAANKITTEEYSEKIEQLAVDHEMATHRIILALINQRLAADGLDETETAILLNLGIQWGIYSDTAIEEMQRAMLYADLMSGKISSISTSLSALQGVYTALSGIMAAEAGGSSTPTASSGSGGSGWVNKGTKGGPGTDTAWWNGSSWYYGDKPPGAATGGLVKVGEQGTEIVKLPDGAFVYNHEQTQQMLGGGVSNITFNISGAGDPKRVADEVVRRLNIQSVGRFK